MQHLVLSTDNIPRAERFSYWRDAVTEIGIPGERDRSPETGFDGRLVATVGDCFGRFRFGSSKYRVSRQSHQTRRYNADDRFWLYRDVGGGSWHDHDGRQFITRAGEMIVGFPALPLATEALDRYDHELWYFPRALLAPHLPAAQGPRMLQVAGREGINGIILSYLEVLSEQVDALSDAEAGQVADNFCRLLALACGGGAGDHRDAVREARFAEAKRYIHLHLADPCLTPATAAGALNISVRHLHSLFEPSGSSFAQYVLKRRLEECRAALASPAGERSVTDIALAWGFNSLSTFYRAFRQAFGATPTELRRRARQSN